MAVFFMFNETIIQIEGNKVLTNKGRIFEELFNTNGKFWVEVTLPDFANKLPQNQLPKGKSQFIESINIKEKFNKADNITDLL